MAVERVAVRPDAYVRSVFLLSLFYQDSRDNRDSSHSYSWLQYPGYIPATPVEVQTAPLWARSEAVTALVAKTIAFHAVLRPKRRAT